MTDCELLELAAKAAGITKWEYLLSNEGLTVEAFGIVSVWNPLTDDGDALRLAVKLGMRLEIAYRDSATHIYSTRWITEHHNNDPYAATRRAIVRAAAEIGRGMK